MTGTETETTFLKDNAVKFDIKEYAVTDPVIQAILCLTCPLHFLPCIPGILGTKTMVLEEEEAVLKINFKPFCSIETRRPYGELGSVDKHHCLCCVGVASNLSSSIPLYLGSGCDEERVSEIVAELKKRMKARGDTGQIARTEEALKEIHQLRNELIELKADMKLVLRALNVPEASEAMDRS